MYVPLLGLAARAVISSLTTGSTSGFPASSASPTQSATYASIQPSQEATILALSPATSPPTSAMLVDPSFVNLAFEFGAMPDYTCNDPESGDYSLNTFSANLIDNIFGLQSGGVPIIRIGGTTGDFATYDTSQSQPVQPVDQLGSSLTTAYDTTWKDQLYVLAGEFGQSLHPTATWLTQITLQNSQADYEAYVKGWANNFTQYLGMDNIFAIEIGNEPNQYDTQGPIEQCSPQHTPAPSASCLPTNYVDRFLEFEGYIDSVLPSGSPKKIYQFSDMADAGADKLDPADILLAENGKLNNGELLQAAIHYYQTSGGGHVLTDILSFDNIRSQTATVVSRINALSGSDFPLVIDEFGQSIGQDDTDFQNVLGSSLFRAAFSMYCMTIGVHRLHHQSLLSSYGALWLPHASSSVDPQPFAAYYGVLMAAEFVGPGTNTKVYQLANPSGANADYFGAFAAYDDGSLSRIALFDLKEYNTTESGRPINRFTLTNLDSSATTATVKHLNSQAGTSGSPATISYDDNQYPYSNHGKAQGTGGGTTSSITITGGQVTVTLEQGSAALVTFS